MGENDKIQGRVCPCTARKADELQTVSRYCRQGRFGHTTTQKIVSRLLKAAPSTPLVRRGRGDLPNAPQLTTSCQWPPVSGCGNSELQQNAGPRFCCPCSPQTTIWGKKTRYKVGCAHTASRNRRKGFFGNPKNILSFSVLKKNPICFHATSGFARYVRPSANTIPMSVFETCRSDFAHINICTTTLNYGRFVTLKAEPRI